MLKQFVPAKAAIFKAHSIFERIKVSLDRNGLLLKPWPYGLKIILIWNYRTIWK
jgi:hypothetical protein